MLGLVFNATAAAAWLVVACLVDTEPGVMVFHAWASGFHGAFALVSAAQVFFEETNNG